MKIGEKIKKYRKEKGLTQKKLGELCGMSEAQIGQYENGYREPKRETLEKIANALETDYLDFLDNDKYTRLLNKSIEVMVEFSSYACPYELIEEGYFKKECAHCIISNDQDRKCWKEYFEGQ